MLLSRRAISLLSLLSVIFAVGDAAALQLNPGIQAHTSYFRVVAAFERDDFAVFSLPFTTSHSVTDRGHSARAEYSISDAGLEISYDLARAGGVFRNSVWVTGALWFSVDAPTPYSIDGLFETQNPANRVLLGVSLLDEGSGEDVFRNIQESYSTPDEVFQVGQSRGDVSNSLLGSPSGLLLPGREYRFVHTALMNPTADPPTAGGTGTGYARLTLVPEPSPLFLVALGLALLRGRSKRGLISSLHRNIL